MLLYKALKKDWEESIETRERRMKSKKKRGKGKEKEGGDE